MFVFTSRRNDGLSKHQYVVSEVVIILQQVERVVPGTSERQQIERIEVENPPPEPTLYAARYTGAFCFGVYNDP